MCVSSPYRQGILYRMLFFFRYRSIDYVESVYLIFRLLDLYTSLLGNLSNTKPVYLVLFSSFFQVLLPSDKPSLVCSRCFQLFSPPSPSSSAPRKDSLSSQYHLDLSELHDMSLLNDTNNPSLSLYNTSISSSFDSLSQRSSDGLGLVCCRQPLIFDLSSCSIIHAKQEYTVITQFNYDFQ